MINRILLIVVILLSTLMIHSCNIHPVCPAYAEVSEQETPDQEV
jgi:hypothetical protein